MKLTVNVVNPLSGVLAVIAVIVAVPEILVPVTTPPILNAVPLVAALLQTIVVDVCAPVVAIMSAPVEVTLTGRILVTR